MLVVFAFSITPTIVFHNWLASHTDSVKKSTHADHAQVGKRSFNCHCDHIVAESPFTGTDHILIPAPHQVFFQQEETGITQLQPSPHFNFSLRGPPVV